jgi:5-methylcytosine-specific restriction endonuclease McrA
MISKTKKQCKVDECSSPLWGKGFCSFHYKMEKVKENKGLKKTVSVISIEKKKIKTENTKKLHEFMKEWWESFGKYKKCMACNKLLPIDFSTINVDHLVSKKVYPQFAFDVNNFYLCCADCHHAKELGFPKEHHKQAIINFKKTI